jgi:hypothetical protein
MGTIISDRFWTSGLVNAKSEPTTKNLLLENSNIA